MPTTRQRIMEYLKTNHQASALALSQFFQMTPANIRHHLAILEQDGQIEVVGQAEVAGRGRPTLLYMPTRQAENHNLEALTTILLADALERRGKKQRQAKLQKLAARLGAGAAAQGGSLPLRLSTAMQRLNELHYKAHWEAHTEAPHIILGHCPYSTLIERHPELCQLDGHLLENLLGVSVQQTVKCSRAPDGPAQCVFIVAD